MDSDMQRLPTIANPPTLSDLAYASVRSSILSGGFQMGERLNEARIAADMGVSRGPLREALKRLSEEGLLTEKPRVGMSVPVFTADDVTAVNEVRIALERLAVQLIVRRNVDLSPLRIRLTELRDAAQRGDTAATNLAEFDLHEELCRLSQNEHLLSTYQRVRGRIQLALTVDNAASKSLEEVLDEHVLLVEALQGATEEEAARIIEAHIA